MTILFQGNRNIPAGVDENVVAIPRNIKQLGESLEAKISLAADGAGVLPGVDNFPNGNTSVQVFLSMDGGVTYPRSAGDTFNFPDDVSQRGSPPHYFFVGFTLADSEDPTHAKFVTNAPAAFTTQVIIEATSVKTRLAAH